MADLRPPLSHASSAFAVPATVTPVGFAPVQTTAIFLLGALAAGLTNEAPAAAALRDRLVVLPAAAVPSLEIGSRIDADAGEGVIRSWRVDRVLVGPPDERRVAVTPADFL